VPANTEYADVELTDGTLFRCGKVTLREKNVEIVLLAGQHLTLPVTTVSNILKEANVEKYRKDWTARLGKKRNFDILARLDEGVISPFPGTFGDADKEGKTIEFRRQGKDQSNVVPLANIHGMIFDRKPDPQAPPMACKVTDKFQNVLIVSSVEKTATGYTFTTPAGAKVPCTTEVLCRVDYSPGNLAYLSEMEPSKVVETSTEERVEHYRRDRNLDDAPLRLKGQTYARGLALHSYTELEYDLKGEYLEFKTVAGIDDAVSGIDTPVQLLIEADGVKLLEATFSRKDKERARPITLNVKDRQKLRIVVGPGGDLLDLGKHLNLCDAKVTK
jgi:hypothetical protein